MIKIVLIGSGNLAVQLAKGFRISENIELIQRYARSDSNNAYFDKSIPVTENLQELKTADLYIIAVSDDSIFELSGQLIFSQGLVVHTSGNMSIKALQCKANKGVFYPLQSFSKDQDINFDHIPLCLETEKEENFTLLESMARTMSKEVYPVNSLQRAKLHLAAVFVNNFTNHLYKIGYDICEKNQLSFNLLKPLIKETAQKVFTIDPVHAQTGPAKRGDLKVIDDHLNLLDKNQKEIYKLLSQSILNTYNIK